MKHARVIAALGALLLGGAAGASIYQSNMRWNGYPYPGSTTTNVTGRTVAGGVSQLGAPPAYTGGGVPPDLGSGGGGGPETPSYPTNLLAGYMMTGGATETDISGNGYDLTLVGSAPVVTDNLPYRGFVGSARQFDSSGTNYLYGAAADAVLQNAVTAATFAVWMNFSTEIPTTRSFAFGRWDDTSNKMAWMLGMRESTRQLMLGSSDTGNFESGVYGLQQFGSLTTNAWFHLAVVTYDSLTYSLYRGAELVNTNSTLRHPFDINTTPLTIGATFDEAYRFNGLIAEPVMFNRALSQDEITRLAFSGVSRMGTNTMTDADYNRMVGGWLMNNATDVADISPVGGQIAHAGATISGSGPTLVTNVPPGFSGYSLDFEYDDGDYLIVSNLLLGAQIKNLLYEGTIMMWVRPESYPAAANALIGRRDPGQPSYSWGLTMSSTGPGRVNTHSAKAPASEYVNGEFGVKPAGSWYHIAYTFSRTYAPPLTTIYYGDVTWYVNGVVSRDLSALNNIVPFIETFQPLMIGASGTEATPTQFFDGMIDEVAVYNYAMDIAEINSKMTNGIDGAAGGND